MFRSQLPQPDKTPQLNDKMLDLAENLLLEEMSSDGLFACGSDLTCKAAGKYGLYETFNGELISFQPKATLDFTLVCNRFIITGNLATIQIIARYLSNYQLLVVA